MGGLVSTRDKIATLNIQVIITVTNCKKEVKLQKFVLTQRFLLALKNLRGTISSASITSPNLY